MKKEKFYSDLEINSTLSVLDYTSDMNLLYSLTADGDVDAWEGWLIDQEGSEY